VVPRLLIFEFRAAYIFEATYSAPLASPFNPVLKRRRARHVLDFFLGSFRLPASLTVQGPERALFGPTFPCESHDGIRAASNCHPRFRESLFVVLPLYCNRARCFYPLVIPSGCCVGLCDKTLWCLPSAPVSEKDLLLNRNMKMFVNHYSLLSFFSVGLHGCLFLILES